MLFLMAISSASTSMISNVVLDLLKKPRKKIKINPTKGLLVRPKKKNIRKGKQGCSIQSSQKFRNLTSFPPKIITTNPPMDLQSTHKHDRTRGHPNVIYGDPYCVPPSHPKQRPSGDSTMEKNKKNDGQRFDQQKKTKNIIILIIIIIIIIKKTKNFW